jgi:hypothetical protein
MRDNEIKEVSEMFTFGEHLAHQLAYHLHEYSSVQLLNNKKYTVHKLQVCTLNTGLIGYILEPEKGGDIYVVFRGTKDFASVLRDLNPGSPGTFTFEKYKKSILNDINQVIENVLRKNPGIEIEVTMAGHSLGATDAGAGMAALIEALHIWSDPDIKSDDAVYFTHIKTLRLMTYNSPGVTVEMNDEANKHARAIANKVKIECYHLIAAGDGVQQAGQCILLANAPMEISKNYFVKVYHVDVDEDVWKYTFNVASALSALWQAVIAHTSCYFIPRSNKSVLKKAIYYSNAQDDHEAIKKELLKSSALLQTFLIQIPQGFICGVVNSIVALFNSQADDEIQQQSIPDPWIDVHEAESFHQMIQSKALSPLEKVEMEFAKRECIDSLFVLLRSIEPVLPVSGQFTLWQDKGAPLLQGESKRNGYGERLLEAPVREEKIVVMNENYTLFSQMLVTIENFFKTEKIRASGEFVDDELKTNYSFAIDEIIKNVAEIKNKIQNGLRDKVAFEIKPHQDALKNCIEKNLINNPHIQDHRIPGTKIGRALINFIMVVPLLGQCVHLALRNRINETRSKPGCYFFSLKPKRICQARKLADQLARLTM